MLKRIFSIIFTIFLISAIFLSSATVSAFEPTEFEITAKSGMLVCLDTDEILFEKDIDAKVYPASIAKIMTVTLMLESENYNPEGKVAMTKEVLNLISGTGSSVSNLQVGEEITQLDLVYMVLMSSFGDCAYLAAITYGGSVENFVDMMNNKAKELGLDATHYGNPVGLHDEETYTTVRDTYTLTKYALKNETFTAACQVARHTIPATNMHGERTLSTTNRLQDPNTNYYYQYAKGVKTGFTDEAGRCLVSTASHGGYNYMCILMKCPNSASHQYQFAESRNLYRWAFNNFSFKEVANSKDPVCEIPLELSLDTDFVPLYFKEPFVTVLPNDADDSTIVVKTHFKNETIKAPVKKGQVLGTAEIIFAEKTIGTVDLVAGKSVEASWILVAVAFVKSVLTSSVVKWLIVIAVVAVIIFIALCIRLNISKIKKRKVRYIPYKEDINRHEK